MQKINPSIIGTTRYKMKIITVTNQKGGTGKTTTSLFLKDALIEKGKKFF